MGDADRFRVLVVEDDAALLEALTGVLRAHDLTPVTAGTLAAGLARLEGADYEVALLGLTLPDGSGMEILRRIVEERRPTESIVLAPSPESAIEAMRLGAYDSVAAPVRMDEVKLLVTRAAEKSRLRRENAKDLLRSLAEVERHHIEAVLRLHGGHRGRTARALGIDPKTLYNKLGPERPRRKG